ncbi:UDP-N-acetyl glucosamine 2-epimerase [Rhodobacteraceae bacterium]|nr:UDP-N-acetyl glucosamine 2-epimerase [Paracoccaceae bacterium]
MTHEHLSLYLDKAALTRVNAGTHNFFHRLAGAVKSAGWTVSAEENTLSARFSAATRKGYALYHMEPPSHDRALTCRRTYTGAFWHIEAEAERWNWPVAQTAFDPAQIDLPEAERFFETTRNRMFGDVPTTADHGFILMPLQGRLSEHRSFQSMSPLQMIEEVMVRVEKPVRATLHPNETYTPADRQALVALANRFPHFSVEEGNSAELLRNCSYVITQNSGVAFEGYLLRKPAVLFAKIDFHHIAGSVPQTGVDDAFARIEQPIAFERYIAWFLQSNALNAGRPEFETQILAHLREKGWPIWARQTSDT